MSIIRAFWWLFWGETEQFSGRVGALRWIIFVGKQKHNVQKPGVVMNPHNKSETLLTIDVLLQQISRINYLIVTNITVLT